jgi:hypothetical protein
MWSLLQQQMGDALPPLAGVSEDGVLAMSWDRGPRHFELELFANGTYDWFYVDYEHAQRGSGEQLPVNAVTPEMCAYLSRTTSRPWRS